MSNEEKLIADYVQTFGDTKSDLDFKSKSITFVRSITCQDSANYYDSITLISCHEQLSEDYPNINGYIQRLVEKDSAYVKVIFENERLADLQQEYGDTRAYYAIQEKIKDLKKNQLILIEYKKQLLATKNNIERLENCSNEILCNIWECEFSAFNPLLQVRQEIKRKYLFNSDNTEVIKSLSDD
jgi:hypothetical protein